MASEAQTSDSVFDILYADTRRLSSLLSQFSDDGIVTELIRASEESSASKVGVSVKVVSVDGTETGRESTSRKMDPQWLLPLMFLDQAQDWIQHDITAAAIGSLVLSQGKLIVTDLRILQEMWKSPAMRKFILQQGKPEQEGTSRQARRAAGRKSTDANQEEAILDLLPFLPHSPQVNIVTDDMAVWATIEPTYLSGSVEDLMLKHGAKVAGSWSIVGILDARPWEERDDAEYDEWLTGMEQMRIGMFGDNIWKVATELAGHVRTALGRPYLSYAITPLIIFREVETLPRAAV